MPWCLLLVQLSRAWVSMDTVTRKDPWLFHCSCFCWAVAKTQFWMAVRAAWIGETTLRCCECCTRTVWLWVCIGKVVGTCPRRCQWCRESNGIYIYIDITWYRETHTVHIYIYIIYIYIDNNIHVDETNNSLTNPNYHSHIAVRSLCIIQICGFVLK